MVDTSIFALTGKVVVITGAGGLLGQEHALAVARAGGLPVLFDVSSEALGTASDRLESAGLRHHCLVLDVTDEQAVGIASRSLLSQYGPMWGLVNNVASNPPMGTSAAATARFETFPLDQWDMDIRVGLTSAFVCARLFGEQMAMAGGGSIVNVASDLALISPDQRIYSAGLPDGISPPTKAVSYPVVKSGLLGLTRYLATYWAPTPVRCNTLVPGSVGGTQGSALTQELEKRIPLGRLADPDEYTGALTFLLSDASKYMTGASLVVDGGRTIW